VTSTTQQEYVLHAPKSLKLVAASALAVAALGTPLAQAATDVPPGPNAHTATDLRGDPGPGGGLQDRAPGAQATDVPPGPGAQARIIAI